MALDYNTMDDATLIAMLDVATEDNAQIINGVLESRKNHKIPIIPLRVKASDEELAKRVKELRDANVGKRCKLVPYNSDNLINGIIRGVIANHESQKPFYSIIDTEGIRHTIDADSPALEISEEFNDVIALKEDEWTADKAIKENLHYVGQIVAWTDSRGEGHRGRVVSVITDVRLQRASLRIKEYRKSLDILREKLVYTRKLVTALGDCTFSEDSQTKGVRNGYELKMKLKVKRKHISPEQRVALCRTEYEDAKKIYERAKEILEMRAKNLVEAEERLKKETLRQIGMEENDGR